MLLILIGKSGTGKDALQKLMTRKGFKRIVTSTTRPIRDGEVDGVDYHFKTKDEFLTAIENNFLLEYRTYNTLLNGVEDVWYYGTFKEELNPKENYVIVLDIEGAKAFKKYYESTQDVLVVYINTKYGIRRVRAESRGSFDEIEWNRRLKSDNEVFSNSNIKSIANVTINNNGSLGSAFAKLEKIVSPFK